VVLCAAGSRLDGAPLTHTAASAEPARNVEQPSSKQVSKIQPSTVQKDYKQYRK
jgi:hypothetical protein